MNALYEIAVNHGLAREDSPSSRRQKLFDTEGATAESSGGAPQDMDPRLQSKAIPTFPLYRLACPSTFSISSIASLLSGQEDVLPFSSTITSSSASTQFPVTPYSSILLGDSMLSFYSLASGNDATPFQSAITRVEEPSRRRSWAERFLSLFHINEKLPIEPEAIVNPYNGLWRSASTIAVVNASEEAEDDEDDDLSVYNDDSLLYSDLDDLTTMTSISALPAPALRTRPWVDSYLSLLQPYEPSVRSNHSTTDTASTQQPSGPAFRHPVPVWLGQYIAVARIAQPDVALDDLIELYEASKFMLDENGDPLKMLPAEALPEPISRKRVWRRALKKAASKVCAKFNHKKTDANGCAVDGAYHTNCSMNKAPIAVPEIEQQNGNDSSQPKRRTELTRKVVSLFKSKLRRSADA
ncbi:hypothetical protein BCR37DRAFT_394723 [Protomyces lactucae-debilis]|uniref:Uncharacterized protein n=1 Tax=Protomyces lactucae-debilis TaxID=2754530 RepID=A0A1Y2F4H2_PROLT|nr:uncharacterized protein BCR37DRAFT_394723 [Protomyces lactucae-debilis]ORY78226.1 hypothetical protein BCR37DRAFT_394723 [Protomyces lactucae-debilis]